MTLRLTDLNDFIQPSQQCVVTPQPMQSQTKTMGEYQVVREDDPLQQQYASPPKISLNDCLACSGCITSAESVLITMQSQEEIYRVLEENQKLEEAGQSDHKRVLVISLSPQTRASFAAKYQATPLQAAQRLTHFFHTLAAPSRTQVFVFDTSFSRDLSLLATYHEFTKKLEQREHGHSGGFPMLASACPGWICYAEKTQGVSVLEHISRARSPQQVMGWLVKDYFAQHLFPNVVDAQERRRRIFHCALMPCFDKKLEASRKDFTSFPEDNRQEDGIRDVDCVLSSGEVEWMLQHQQAQQHGLSLVSMESLEASPTFNAAMFAEIPSAPLDGPFWKAKRDPESGEVRLLGTEGGASGGYVDFLAKRYAQQRQRTDPKSTVTLSIQPGRNADILEYTITVDGQVETRMATAYGFRNIQNVVRRIKQQQKQISGRPTATTTTSVISSTRSGSGKIGWEQYDFIEVMACPSGCINGGGQLKPNDGQVERIGAMKEFVAEMDRAYASVQPCQDPDDQKQAATMEMVAQWLGGWDSTKAQELLYTEYHDVTESGRVSDPASASNTTTTSGLTASWFFMES